MSVVSHFFTFSLYRITLHIQCFLLYYQGTLPSILIVIEDSYLWLHGACNTSLVKKMRIAPSLLMAQSKNVEKGKRLFSSDSKSIVYWQLSMCFYKYSHFYMFYILLYFYVFMFLYFYVFSFLYIFLISYFYSFSPFSSTRCKL